MILAVWVLLQFIDRVDPMAHYPATYPSQIFFLKEDIGMRLLSSRWRTASDHQTASASGGSAVYPCPATYQHGAGAGLAICASPVCDCGLQRTGDAGCTVLYGKRGDTYAASEFERALGAAEHRAGRAAVELARTRRLLEREDMAGAFGAAFAFSAEVEKLALARVLPAYTGHPKAAELEGADADGHDPVEMG